MPTRLYLERSAVAAVSPDFGAWDRTTDATRRQLLASKTGASLSLLPAFTTVLGTVLRSQFVSEPLEAQTISGTVKSYCVVALDIGLALTSRLLVKVVSGDGTVLRGTLLALDNYGGAAFSSSSQNRIFADGDALSAVNVQAGDRLVVEIGAGGVAGDEVFFQLGAPSGGTDLPEDETTTSGVPWIEFSGTISFEGGAAVTAPNLLLLGVG